MRHLRAGVLSLWGLALVALLVLAWGMAQGQAVLLVIAAMLAFLSALVIAGVSLPGLGVLFVWSSVFVSSWDVLTVGSLEFRTIFLIIGAGVLWISHGFASPPTMPWWFWVFGLCAILVSVGQVLFPVSPTYLANRYATSSFGQSLGERPGELPSLVVFLFVALFVPLVIVLACSTSTRTFDKLVCAYVGGTTLSALAAFFGYIGLPFMLNVFGVTTPPHVRQVGFTTFPLRLSTSIVFALPLAYWLALRARGEGGKWLGRSAVPLLILGLYVSGSRAATVAAMVGLVFALMFLPQLRRRSHWVASGAAALVGAVVLFFPHVSARILSTLRLTSSNSTDVSDQGRVEVFHQAIADMKESPVFGIGIRYLAEAHSTYVGIGAAGGAVLVLGFLAVNLSAFRMAADTARTNSVGGALMATLGTGFAYWTVGIVYAVNNVQIIYGFVIAAASLAARGHSDRDPVPLPEMLDDVVPNPESRAWPRV